MKNKFQFLIVLIVLISRFATAADPQTIGLFLSFEQRIGLTYALLAQDKSNVIKKEILERATAYFNLMTASPAQTVKVQNFDEFMLDFKGDWPNTQSVALDIKIIEKTDPRSPRKYISDSPRVQRQIDDYLQWQESQIKEMASKEDNSEAGLMHEIEQQIEDMASSKSGQASFEKWAFKKTELLLSDRMKDLDRVGQKMADFGFSSQQDSKVRIFMQTMFSEYFSRLSSASKKLIVSSYLGGDLNMSDLKKFEIMVQNSGPQLQKLLQIVARQDDMGPEMLEIFRGLESSVRPVPWVQVEDILKSESNNYKFTYFEKKPLGVGTMAQVHRAKIEVAGERKDVVVRFIKPDIAQRVEEDRYILTQVAQILDNNPEFKKTGTPLLGPIVEDLTATVTAELNQAETVQRQNFAKTRYEKSVDLITSEYKNILEFHVPSLYPSAKRKSQFMVQELVIGKKLDKEALFYKDLAPNLKRAIVEATAKLWAEEVMFGAGFYHSDLHQGNFLVQLTEPKVLVNILDYGMGGIISYHLQKQSLVLGAGIELNNEDLISRAFLKIARASNMKISEKQFKAMVAQRVASINESGDANHSLEDWTSWAMAQGLQLPYEFISLNRGIVIVNKMLQDSGSRKSVNTIMRDYARSHPMAIYKILVIEENVEVSDLVKLGWGELQRLINASQSTENGLRCESVFL